MTDIESTDEFDDELLSAYVDGELDEDQRAQVEQRLREDLRAKQLVSELQSLSQTLRSLPQEQVGTDLRKAVMQQVDNAHGTVVTREGSRGSTRRWVWASMAIAATLFLMVSQPQENEEEKKLAQAEPQLGREVRSPPEMRAPLEAMVPKEMAAGSTFADESAATAVMEEAETTDFDREATELDIAAGEGPELCLVYLTCPKPIAGRQRFDELLASNGIVLEGEPAAAVGRSQRSSAVANNRRTPLATGGSDDLAEAEAVLVEASQSQVEGLLEDCYADVRNLESLSFRDQTDSRLPAAEWRGYERKGEQKNLATAEEKLAKSRKPHPSRGRATRVGADWYQSQVQQNVVAGGVGGVRPKAKEKSADSRPRKEAKPETAGQVRVLFFLLPPEAAKE